MEDRYSKENIKRIRPFLSECCVLLKKDDSFPLDGPCRIACFGSGVFDTVKGGTGSGEVNSRYSVTIEEALIDEGFTITNRDWYQKYEPFYESAKKEFYKDIKDTAKRDKVNIIAASMGKVMMAPEYDIDLDLSAEQRVCIGRSRISLSGVRIKIGQVAVLFGCEGSVVLSRDSFSDHLVICSVGAVFFASGIKQSVNSLLCVDFAQLRLLSNSIYKFIFVHNVVFWLIKYM